MSEATPDDLHGRLKAVTELPFLKYQMADKLDLTLIALGHKKATRLIFSKSDPELEQKKTALIDAGFECDWSRDEAVNPENVELCVADSIDTLARIQGASNEDEQDWGDFAGYPKTATEAYMSGDESKIIQREDLPAEIRQQDWCELLHFRLSRDHWREEIQTLQRWHKSLQEYAPKLLKEYITHNRKRRVWYQQELERQRREAR